MTLNLKKYSLTTSTVLLFATLCFFVARPLYAVDAEQLSELLDYRIIAATALDGSWNGSMPGNRIRLKNGMGFEMTSYTDDFLVEPKVIVLQKSLSVENMPASGVDFTVYRIIIGSKLYPVVRVK